MSVLTTRPGDMDPSPRSKNENDKPKIIGLFGVPGSGKTTTMHHLQQTLSPNEVTFFEGSDIIAQQTGSLAAFQNSNGAEKLAIRQSAIVSIQNDCKTTRRLGVVTGHFSFWPEGNIGPEEIMTEADLDVYTHIVYLEPPAEEVEKRVEEDGSRPERERGSAGHVRRWQEVEKGRLRELCYQNGILFTLVKESGGGSGSAVLRLINSFRLHDEKYNTMMALGHVSEAVGSRVSGTGTKPDAMLVIDGDKTLAAEDSGGIFWKQATSDDDDDDDDDDDERPDPLRVLFQAASYSYTSFHQAALLYHEVGNEEVFDGLCDTVAAQVSVHPAFVDLLRKVAKTTHIAAIVVTCGLRLVWQKVLAKLGLSDVVMVIGNGAELSGCVVTPRIKADIVKCLQEFHDVYVWAFGDSPLDLPMLQQADQALVVVGEPHKRSHSMEAKLKEAIDHHGLQARQVLLPAHASPRLDTSKLPVVQLTDLSFMQALKYGIHSTHTTTRSAAKLLMTPTRDATMSGPALREAHRNVGRYLATEILSDLLGVQETPIRHVQGGSTNGYRVRDERTTTIIALMRGGEPMAFGVSDVLRLSVFLHAKKPADVERKHVKRQSTVILVDSVVNNGETVADFVQHLRTLRPTIRIVVVAGVVQADALREGALLDRALAEYGGIDLVALRLSQNKYTGRGGTDTGARLFGTTHLEK